MKIKFLLIIAALLFVSNNKVQSQERFSKSQLSGLTVLLCSSNDQLYNEKTKEYEKHRTTVIYRWDEEYMHTDIYRDSIKLGTASNAYYLSDKKDEFFDVSKFEKNLDGRYIIVSKDKKDKKVDYFTEILKIDKEEITVIHYGRETSAEKKLKIVSKEEIEKIIREK